MSIHASYGYAAAPWSTGNPAGPPASATPFPASVPSASAPVAPSAAASILTPPNAPASTAPVSTAPLLDAARPPSDASPLAAPPREDRDASDATHRMLLYASLLGGTALTGAVAAAIVRRRRAAADTATVARATTIARAAATPHDPNVVPFEAGHVESLTRMLSADDPYRLQGYAPQHADRLRDPVLAREHLIGETVPTPHLKGTAQAPSALCSFAALHEGAPVGFVTVKSLGEKLPANLAYWFADGKVCGRPRQSAAIAVHSALEQFFARHPERRSVRAVTFTDNKGSQGLLHALQSSPTAKVRVVKQGSIDAHDPVYGPSPRPRIAYEIIRA